MTGEVSHYRVLHKLGNGSMGVVYAAEDLRLGRRVALKFLAEKLADDAEALERFHREARAASSLNHPGICTLYEVGEHEGKPFHVLELLEGETLKQRLAGGGELENTLDLALQIAGALEAAHAKGIVHRDIKPSNIFITSQGKAKVLDFGIAKSAARHTDSGATTLGDIATLTATGARPGTLAYMSPEQSRGADVDARSDIYSFGLVLEKMAGPSPSGALRAIIERATERDRQLRYQTASDFRADLERLKRDTTTTSQRVSGSRASRTSKARKATVESLAVLPFANLSDDPEMEYLSEGITDSLINSLAQLRKIRVVPRSQAFRYRGPDTDPLAAGRALKVDVVLSGRVSLRGETLVIGTELLDVKTESQIGGGMYNRKLADIFQVQEEIATQIFDKLKVQLSGDEKQRVNRHGTGNKEAYQLYLKGVFFLHRWSADDLRRSTEYCLQAVALDPVFAPAYAILAMAYCMLGVYNFAPAGDVFPRAKVAATKASELDESLADAHGALATARLFYDFDFAGAEKAVRRALELNPDYSTGHQVYAAYLMAMGRVDQAMTEEQRALELDPLSPAMNMVMSLALFYARRFDEAIAQLHRALELNSNVRVLSLLGWVCAHAGRTDEALAVVKRLMASGGGNPRVQIPIAYTLAVVGREEDARAMFASVMAHRPADVASTFNLAALAAVLGERDLAFECLDQVCAARSGQLIYLRVFPIFDTLHDDPRFEALAQRIGLPK